jgi:hypothetical protein
MRTLWTVAASAIGTKFTQSIKARRERIRVALHSFAIWYEKHPMPTARQSRLLSLATPTSGAAERRALRADTSLTTCGTGALCPAFRWRNGEQGVYRMKPTRGLLLGLSILAIGGSVTAAAAQPVNWSRYSIPETGTSVNIPSSIFSETAGRPDGYGQRFKTADGRANLTIQSAPNAAHDSPASFLAKKNPPSRIQYKRVTSRFFAVSSYKGDDVWYDRCNFSRRFVHCVLINYPAAEERDWDGIITRISLSLKGGD